MPREVQGLLLRRQCSSSAGKTNKVYVQKGATSATGATEIGFVAVVAGKWNYTSDEELVV